MAGRQAGCLEALVFLSSGASVLLGYAVTAGGAMGPAQAELALSTSVGSWQQGGLETSGVREWDKRGSGHRVSLPSLFTPSW